MISAAVGVLTVGFMVGNIGPGFAGVFAARGAMARFFYIAVASVVLHIADKSEGEA